MIKLLCALIFTFSLAKTTKPTASVETKATESEASIVKNLKKIVENEVAKVCSSCKVELEVHNPSILSDVTLPDKVISDRWKGQTNLVLKMGSENRIVTVTIRWMDNVVVAKNNIAQGEPLSEKDLRVVEKDVTYLLTAYAQSVDSIVRMVGRKVFQRGEVVDEAKLTKPIAVRYGQVVKLVLEEGSLKLSMTGQAKGAGAIGDRIPVFVPETRKRLFAVIVDKNTARIE